MTSTDPTHESRLRLLDELLRDIETAIAEVYRERGQDQVRSRFALPLIRLHHLGPMTITALAREVGHTHSAVSQTIAQMRRAGLVRTEAGGRVGGDARTRVVALTEQGRALVPLAEDEWRATEAALAELEAELPYPLSRVAEDMAAALAQRPFAGRLAAHLPDATADGQAPPSATAPPPPPTAPPPQTTPSTGGPR